MRALDKAGLAWNEIQPVYLAPADARAAFERKSVDAWAIWDPFYAATELAIRPRVLANGEGLSGNASFYLAARGLVEHHPQVLRALFDELTRADRLAQSARQEAVALVAGFSGLDAAVVSRFIARRPSSPWACWLRRPWWTSSAWPMHFSAGPDSAPGAGGRHRLAALGGRVRAAGRACGGTAFFRPLIPFLDSVP